MRGNLTKLPGTSITASSQYNATWTTARGADNDLGTSWFSRAGECATAPTCTSVPWFQVTLPAPQTLAHVALRGNREYLTGYDFMRGKFEILGASGALLFSRSIDLPPDRDLDIVFPTPLTRVTSVRFTSEQDESNDPGFAELALFGP